MEYGRISVMDCIIPNYRLLPDIIDSTCDVNIGPLIIIFQNDSSFHCIF